MSKIYTNRQNAIRAARKELGPEAATGEAFTVDAAEGGFTWSPVAEAPSAPPDAAHGPEATSADQAQLGAPNRGAYRRTPEGEPTVADLVRPGMLVRSSYGTGGVVRSVSGPHPLLPLVAEGLETFSIEYGGPDGAKGGGTLNELVAIGGRVLKLFEANADEVFFEEAPAAPEPLPAYAPAIDPVGGLLAEIEAQQAAGEAAAADVLGAQDCPSKRDSLARIASEILGADDLVMEMRHGMPVVWRCPTKGLREALAAAYEAGHAARVLGKRLRTEKAARASRVPREPRGPGRPREGSKLVEIVALLTRPEGTTTREILDATGWPAVSVPQQAKAGGLELRKDKQPGQPTRYFGRLVAASA